MNSKLLTTLLLCATAVLFAAHPAARAQNNVRAAYLQAASDRQNSGTLSTDKRALAVKTELVACLTPVAMAPAPTNAASATEPAENMEAAGDTTRNPTRINATYHAVEDNIVLYPNPAINEINLSFPATLDIRTVNVFNNIGKSVSVFKVNSNNTVLNIETLLSGIYFARLQNGAGELIATIRFTKQ
ncbi:MAG: T9SS C-terminal target domain-containing protein [Chitinophagia bacterium]|nr:T9SS C-terminal target domain-containing protein [Chitinophagia bacterium]